MCAVAAIPYIAMAAAAAGTAAYGANQQKIATERQMRFKQRQIDDSAQAQTDDRLNAAREQRAAAKAASAESGVSGNSSTAILNDILMQSGRDVSRIEKNRENGQLETQQQARSRTSEINGQLVAGAASLGASSGSGMYATYTDYIPKTPDAGQHAPPRITIDRSRFTIGN